jgi:hypothetical protein
MPTSKAISASKLLGKDRYEYYLNELITEKTLGGHKLSNAQLKEAFKKRTNKISFEKFVDKVISTKTVRAASFPGTGPVLGPVGGGLGPKGGALVKSPMGGLATYKKLQVAEDKKEIGGISEYLKDITNSLGNIIKILNQGISADIKNQQQKRRDKERLRRDALEKGLEKGFSAVSKIVDKVVAPVKSILSRIIDFFIKMFLARAIVKLIDWLADPQNQDKVKSLIRFFGDHWGKLLSLYIVFGTSFGKFARGLISLIIRGTIRLGAATAGLAVKAGIGKAGGKLAKVAGFLGGPRGKLLAAGLETAAVVGGTMALSKTIDGGGQKAQGFSGGGYVTPKFPAFAGGGFNFKGMLGGASLGSTFGPLGMLLGGALGGGSSGFVSGEKGVDKVPAMLSDGEFVMSRGAVAKYGVDTLEAMNASGGGTNKPKIISGTTYARTGGYIGDYRNRPFSEDPIGAFNRFLKFKFGVDVSNKSSWGQPFTPPKSSSSSSRGNVSTGSVLTDPVGAVARIANNMGIRTPNVPSSGPKMPGLPGGFKLPSIPSGGGKSGDKNMFQEIQEKLKGPGAATYRDAGSIYAKQMLGGFGGPVSERDLSKDSQQELQKAIQRAKKRTGSEIAKAEAKIKELRSQGAKDGNPALETQKSFLRRLKAGGIRVQYTDYADEKGNMSESAKNAKNILGQFWATERSKKEGGGYRIDDKYDFDMLKTKDQKTGKMRDMNFGELLTQGVFGKGKSTQQRLQAAYLLNPFRGKGDVDMVLGGKRTAAESLGLSGSKTLLGGMLGISGKPKDKNQQALEAKRPWWDKLGMFGGASAKMQREQKANQDFLKKNPSAKLYEKPQRNTGGAYKSRFARPTNAGRTPVKPPAKPSVNVVKVSGNRQGQGGRRGSGSKVTTGNPAVSSAHPQGTKRNQAVLGIKSR